MSDQGASFLAHVCRYRGQLQVLFVLMLFFQVTMVMGLTMVDLKPASFTIAVVNLVSAMVFAMFFGSLTMVCIRLYEE